MLPRSQAAQSHGVLFVFWRYMTLAKFKANIALYKCQHLTIHIAEK